MPKKSIIKSFLLGEVEKLKGMSDRDRLWYIWEYYKYFIIIGVLVLSCLISVAVSLLDPSSVYLNTVMLNLPTASKEAPLPLTDEFHVSMALGKHDKVNAEDFYINFTDQYTEHDYQAVQRLFTLMGAREVDILLTRQEELDALASEVAFANLESILPKDLRDQLQARIVYLTPEEGEAPYPAGINISDTQFVKACGYISQSVIFTMINNTKNPEHCIAMLEYILSYK